MGRGTVAQSSRRAPAAARGSARPRKLSAAEVAWLAWLPCAALAVVAILALGPPLGRMLFPAPSLHFWSSVQSQVRPEPTEQARYVLALLGPLLLAAATAWGVWRRPLLPNRTIRRLVWSAQAAGVAFVAACFVAQRQLRFGALYSGDGTSFHQAYFTPATLLVAALLAAGLIAATRSPAVRRGFARRTRETRPLLVLASAAAVALVAAWLLTAFNTEHTIRAANFASAYHIEFTLDETYSVLDGRTPLVNFVAQYGSLWPYPVAAAMSLLGGSIGVFTALMCLIGGLAMLAMLAVLRRVTRSAASALLLFAPFLATSFFLLRGPLANRYTLANVYSAYPLRFAGPFLLAWLTARHLDRARPRSAWPLFLVAGLVAMNNTDHGVPALGAVLAALLWAEGRPTRDRLGRLALEAAGGLLASFALVSALTLARAGSLPHLAESFRFARLFAAAGFAMLPMPTLGFHLVVYLTFVAAIGVATVRAIDRAEDGVLTGMLAWCGIFGLGAGSYYAGRSHPEVLVDAFSTWSFALALLLVVVLRRLAAQPSRWPAPAEVACLFGFGLAVCSLAQTPTPWSQVSRLQRHSAAVLARPYDEGFVRSQTRRGEPVALLMPLGHRVGADLHLPNVAPYTGSQSMFTTEQLDDALRALRAAGGHKLFVSAADAYPEMSGALQDAGFHQVMAADAPTLKAKTVVVMWTDAPRR